jgi:uncharacterized protein (DUF1499 family)
MSARIIKRDSKLAVWARRIALFSVQLLIIGVLLHRFAKIGSLELTNLLAVSIAGALVALIMGLVALGQIWSRGTLGVGTALTAMGASLVMLAIPLWHLPSLLFKPKINDIVTDPRAPPVFIALIDKRPADANPLDYSAKSFADKQVRAYPEIRPMTLERSREETYELVLGAVKVMGWEVVVSQPPSDEAAGRIEAVAHTPLASYADDVAIMVSSVRNESRIDVRSASRYGEHDFGANAARIQRLFASVKKGLEEGEKNALEMALARRAREARRVREEKERVERAKEAKRRLQLREARRRPPPPVQPSVPSVQEPTVQQRQRGSRRGWRRFWERFGE